MNDPIAVVGTAGGLLLVTVIGAIATWRVLGGGPHDGSRPGSQREEEYLKLADRATAAQERAVDEIAELRARLDHVERGASGVRDGGSR